MPKTRRAAKLAKSQEDEETKLNKERAEKLKIYLKDFDDKVESHIQAMINFADKLCENIKNACSTEILKIPKPLRKMTMAEYFQGGGQINASYKEPTDNLVLPVPLKNNHPEREIQSSKSHKRASSKQMMHKTSSSAAPSRKSTRSRTLRSSHVEPSPLKSTVKPLGKRKGSVQSNTANSGKFRSFTTPITPKFDPRLPITPASGLRRIRPGEQVVLMSLSGSPLIPSDDMNDLAITMPLQEGKMTVVNSQMSLDTSTLNSNMQRKMKLLQKKLKDVSIAPSSSK